MVSSFFINGRFVLEVSFDGATSVTNLVFDSSAIVQAMRTTKYCPDQQEERERESLKFGEKGC